MMDMFDLEQQWELMSYTSTFIVELHLDEGLCPSNLLDQPYSDDCFHVKVFFNDLELFSELSYCEYDSQKCSYKGFKRALRNKMILERNVDEICEEPFDHRTLDYHRVELA